MWGDIRRRWRCGCMRGESGWGFYSRGRLRSRWKVRGQFLSVREFWKLWSMVGRIEGTWRYCPPKVAAGGSRYGRVRRACEANAKRRSFAHWAGEVVSDEKRTL